METRHFIKTLCKQKVKTFFLSSLITLTSSGYHANQAVFNKKYIEFTEKHFMFAVCST